MENENTVTARVTEIGSIPGFRVQGTVATARRSIGMQLYCVDTLSTCLNYSCLIDWLIQYSILISISISTSISTSISITISITISIFLC